MSLFGKILAILNVVVAVIFIYLAAADYGVRRSWAYAVFRQDLEINGLPVDDKDIDVYGHVRANDLTQKTLQDVFQQAGGQPVKTQVEELQNVQRSLQGKINGDTLEVADPQPAAAGARLQLQKPEQKRAWFLLPLARTAGQRETLIAQMKDPAGTKPDEADFNKPFEDALARQNPDDRRQAIADLLIALSEVQGGEGAAPDQQPTAKRDNPAYKRALIVVGLTAAATVVEKQVAALVRMGREEEGNIATERQNFYLEHSRQLGRLRAMADLVQREKEFLDLQKDQTERQRVLVAEREGQVKQLQERLTAARKTTQDELAKQARLEQAVVDAQQQLRDANARNQGLEKQIRSLENK
jgi:hypothetical protein